MAITADIFITPQPIVVSVPPPQPRPAITPADARDGANNQRRESKNQNTSLSFRAVLDTTTFSGIARASTATDSAVWLGEGEDRRARPSRLPESGPIELSGDEASDLFTRAVMNNERKSRAPEFLAATSRYASSYFAGSSFQARPGDTLEMTA